MNGEAGDREASEPTDQDARDRPRSDSTPPCPNCGSPSAVDLVNVSWDRYRRFIPGTIRCSARCWERDPDGYLAAVNRRD